MFLTGNKKLDALACEAMGLPDPFGGGMHRFPEDWPVPAAMELESCVFLYSLVRRARPTFVLQTGCFRGVSAAFIAQALEDNGLGTILSIEIRRDFTKDAEMFVKKAGLTHRSFIIEGDSLQVPCIRECQAIDILLLDSDHSYNQVSGELERFGPQVSEGGFLVLHDPTLRDVRQASDGWLKETGWPRFTFPSARQLDVFQRPLSKVLLRERAEDEPVVHKMLRQGVE